MAEGTPNSLPSEQGNVLNYAARTRRSRWWLVLFVSAALIGAGFWSREPVLSFANERIAIYQFYRGELACEGDSAREGEIVLRTDGMTTGITNAVPYVVPAGRPIPISKPVLRGSAAYQKFCLMLQSGSIFGSTPLGFGGPTSNTFSALRSDATLVDCSKATTTSGDAVLRWITIASSGDSVEIVACSTAIGTAMHLPDPSRLKSTLPGLAYTQVAFRSEAGTVTVRRIAADRPQDVRLSLEHAGGTTTVTAEWTGGTYVLKNGSESPTSVTDLNGSLRLMPAAAKLPVVHAESTLKLPHDLAMCEAIAADATGLVILSQSRYGSDLRSQVHRMDWAESRVVELLPANRMLANAVLSTDGSRVTSQLQISSQGPLEFNVFDLHHRTRRTIPAPELGGPGGWHFSIVDDGKNLFVAGLRTPILHFDANLKLIESIPSDRAELLFLNGQYLTRNTGETGSIDVFDFQNHRWSKPLENPFGATQVCGSPDGQLVCCGSNAWCVLDVATGNLVATLEDIHFGSAAEERAVFSPDGRWLFVTLGNGAYLLDLRDRSAPRRMEIDPPARAPAPWACFTPDNKRLVLLRGQELKTVSLDAVVKGGL